MRGAQVAASEAGGHACSPARHARTPAASPRPHAIPPLQPPSPLRPSSLSTIRVPHAACPPCARPQGVQALVPSTPNHPPVAGDTESAVVHAATDDTDALARVLGAVVLAAAAHRLGRRARRLQLGAQPLRRRGVELQRLDALGVVHGLARRALCLCQDEGVVDLGARPGAPGGGGQGVGGGGWVSSGGRAGARSGAPAAAAAAALPPAGTRGAPPRSGARPRPRPRGPPHAGRTCAWAPLPPPGAATCAWPWPSAARAPPAPAPPPPPRRCRAPAIGGRRRVRRERGAALFGFPPALLPARSPALPAHRHLRPVCGYPLLAGALIVVVVSHGARAGLAAWASTGASGCQTSWFGASDRW
jgi:hypothetical protein